MKIKIVREDGSEYILAIDLDQKDIDSVVKLLKIRELSKKLIIR